MKLYNQSCPSALFPLSIAESRSLIEREDLIDCVELSSKTAFLWSDRISESADFKEFWYPQKDARTKCLTRALILE